ncbi:hypothetical protein ACSBR2_025539 [Camellia fascicularis]
MANNGQEEKIGDDIHNESGEHVDPNLGEENHNEGAYDPNPGEKDVGREGNALKKEQHDVTTIPVAGHGSTSGQD